MIVFLKRSVMVIGVSSLCVLVDNIQRSSNKLVFFSLLLFFLFSNCDVFTHHYALPVAGGRRDRTIHFPKTLAWSEMQIASSMTWAGNANSISYHDNHYDKCPSFLLVRVSFFPLATSSKKTNPVYSGNYWLLITSKDLKFTPFINSGLIYLCFIAH